MQQKNLLFSILVIFILISWLFSFVYIIPLKDSPQNTGKIHCNAIIWTDSSAVARDLGGNPVIITQQIEIQDNPRIITNTIHSSMSPSTKPNVTATINGSDVILTWLPVTDSTKVLYLIYQDGHNIANTTSLYYIVPNLPNGEYQFHIKAMNELGDFSDSSTVLNVQIGTKPLSNSSLVTLIIVIGAAIGIVIGKFTYSKGVGKILPSIISEEKPSWISKALGYSPEFEQKLFSLGKDPKTFENIQDPELSEFLNHPFTILPSTFLTIINQRPLSDSEKIEILQILLILSHEQRLRLLKELIEDQEEVAP